MTEGTLPSRRAVLGVGLALPVLAACGAEADDQTTSNTPRRGGRLRAAFIGASSESPNVLQAVMTATDYVRARVIWDCIGELDDAYQPRWRVAESVRSNADATRWTIRVRKGITFSNGKELDAEDVLFSLRSYVDKKSPKGPMLMDIDWANSRARDARTAELALKAPNAFYDLMLCHSHFIFPAGTTDFTKAPGSGPFIPVRYAAGRGSLMKRNPSYWGGPGPYLDELEILSITEASGRLNAVKSGQADYAATVPLTAARAERGNRGVRVINGPRNTWVSIGMAANTGLKPFTDPRITEALRLAVNREEMVRNVTLGFGEPANDLLGKHLPYYDNSLPQRAHDPDKAKALLRQAGAEGLALKLRTGDYEYGMTESATLFAEQAKAAGFSVSLDKVPAADYYSDMRKSRATPLQSMTFHSRPLPLEILLFHDKNALMPFFGPATPELAGLIARMRRATTESKKQAVLKDLQRNLHQQGGAAIFARAPQPAVAKPKVHGVQARGYASFPSFADAWLA